MSKLFTPVKIGSLQLSHRVVMAPLTRLRAESGDIPGDIMAEYYGQRASEGGFIIAEATTVAITGRGYMNAPGIYSDAQIAGWQKVTETVHQKGGHIYLQLWHVGRTGHADLMNGEAPVSASVTPYEGLSYTANGWVQASPNRALTLEEIPAIVEAYRQGAERAKRAGFDGVELHAANGYLLDQFLQDGSNQRTDAYGGSVENRARLLLEVVEAVTSVWGGQHVGVRLAPSGQWNGMHDSNPKETFGYVATALNRFDLAYLHIVEPRIVGGEAIEAGRPPIASAELRKLFNGTILAAGGFEKEDAEAIVEKGDADLVVFGRHFISNPDLPERLNSNLPLNSYDRNTFYYDEKAFKGNKAIGYTDYPVYNSQIDTVEIALQSV